MFFKIFTPILFLSLCICPVVGGSEPTPLTPIDLAARLAGQSYERNQEPEYVSFKELKSLSRSGTATGQLREKLNKLWSTPIISNAAYYRGARPRNLKSADLGPFLRVASWNIEKSIKANEAIQFFTSDSAFRLMINPETQKDPLLYRKIMGQRERLLGADILILQEMEIGIKRSGYLNAAEELAKALDMNYAYATQYLEVDPVILGLENIRYEDGNVDTLAMDFFAADPAKYKGMFGGAVLSRYPIKHVEVRPLKTQPYDWYAGEKKRTTFLEEARRFGSLSVFKNEITREMKVGGRTYFRVDLDVPGLPSHTLTVINIHLEIKCLPQAREAQLTEIFSYIRDIKNPVILMGDFNAAPTDISPTSLTRVAKRTAKNPTTWFGVAVNAVSPHGLALNTTRGLSNVTKNFNDPFAKDIKVVAPNPLLSMFEMIRDYRFRDGGVFDFRGDPKRSVGEKEKILANSNQRGNKGFRTSFSTRRTIGNLIGKLRLDWVFVKSYLKTESTDVLGPYKFAPHFGETLEEMNANLITPISDHHPNVVDLPFNEPNI